MITVQKLTRRFGPFVAVDSLDFHVERGEVVGFLGPNGAGKTTTMRILTGYLPATSGSAQIAGFDVLRDSMEVRRRIGYLPETVPLYREHRVEEMLRFQARLRGMSRSDAKQRIPAVLERTGVLDRSRTLVGSLSRGLRQRVGLAVALLADPEVLILDEPTSGLDPLQRLEVRKLVSELAEEHTLLVSSHILPEIEAVCPRVLILSEGRLAADGTKAELVAELGGSSHVRLEAVVGPDPAEAARLIGTLAGVDDVVDEGRLGIHHQFVVRCREDLREDVGALAMTRGWAVRELSWQQPTLESLFAKIALGIDTDPTPASVPEVAAEEPVASEGSPLLSVAGPAEPLQAAAQEEKAPPEKGAPGMSMLNPFAAPAKPEETPSGDSEE